MAPASASSPTDPSEEISAEELASIPDPTPGTAEPAAASAAVHTAAASTATALPADVAKSPDGSAPAVLPDSAGAHWIWRVQIFASPDLAQAARKSREASARLGEQATIEYEGSLYKVRLGSFTSEDEAQALRERALNEGFPGAFRMRVQWPTNDESK